MLTQNLTATCKIVWYVKSELYQKNIEFKNNLVQAKVNVKQSPIINGNANRIAEKLKIKETKLLYFVIYYSNLIGKPCKVKNLLFA